MIARGIAKVFWEPGQPASKTCPQCGAVEVSAFTNVKGRNGATCARCSWTKWDVRVERHDVSCFTCGMPLGHHYLNEYAALEPFSCPLCSTEWTALHTPRRYVNVRFEVFCLCGCGRLVAWNDFKEHREFRVQRLWRTECLRAKPWMNLLALKIKERFLVTV
jgi:uncharacterized Zn-finger protein